MRHRIATGHAISCILYSAVFCITYASAANPLVPSTGAWVGVSVDWDTWTSANDYIKQAEFTPTSFSIYVSVPLNASDQGLLDNIIPQIASLGGLAVIVAQPSQGLGKITADIAKSFAATLAKYEQQGATMLIEFGHEMNGNWYAWGQQPTQYISTFQTMASAIKKACCRTFMLWNVNNGGGYPFPNGTDIAKYTTSTDFKLLDTNGDGSITQADDPYAPYYPGDSYVDWVGMSIYHWGNSYPYTTNAVPDAQKLTSTIFGTFKSSSFDYSNLPNFYQIYSATDGKHGKPMAIPETGALWDLNALTGSPTELQVKSTWWQQVFNIGGDTTNALDMSVHMPNLKLVAWLDIKKAESSASNNVIDWRFSSTDTIHDAYVSYIKTKTNSTGTAYWSTLPAFINHISTVSKSEQYNGNTVVCLVNSTSSSSGNGTYADPLANLALLSGAPSFASMSIGALAGALLLGVLLL